MQVPTILTFRIIWLNYRQLRKFNWFYYFILLQTIRSVKTNDISKHLGQPYVFFWIWAINFMRFLENVWSKKWHRIHESKCYRVVALSSQETQVPLSAAHIPIFANNILIVCVLIVIDEWSTNYSHVVFFTYIVNVHACKQLKFLGYLSFVYFFFCDGQIHWLEIWHLSKSKWSELWTL